MDPFEDEARTSVVSRDSSLAHDTVFNQSNNLQALLFVAQNRAGPARIISYYPRTTTEQGHESNVDDEEGNLPRASSKSGATDTADAVPSLSRGTTNDGNKTGPKSSTNIPPAPTNASHSVSGNLRSKGENIGMQDTVDRLFDVPKGSLAKLFAPAARQLWHLKKLELYMNGRCFVGCPVFCQPVQASSTGPLEHPDSIAQETIEGREEQTYQDQNQSGKGPIDIQHWPSTTSHTMQNNVTPEDGGLAPHSLQSNISAESMGSERDRKQTSVVIFNVVAVLNCSAAKAGEQSEVYFRHLAKPLARWLRQIQEQSGWIDRQMRKFDQAHSHGTSEPTTSAHGQLNRNFSTYATSIVSEIDRLLRDLFVGLNERQSAVLQIEDSHHSLTLKLPQVLSSPFLPVMDSRYLQNFSNPALRSARLSTSGSRWTLNSTTQRGEGGASAASLRRHTDNRDLLYALEIETDEPLAVSKYAAIVLMEDREDLMKQLSPNSNAQIKSSPFILQLRSSRLTQALIYFIRNVSYRRTLAQLTEPPQSSVIVDPATIGQSPAVITPLMPGLTLRDAQVMSCLLIRAGVARVTLPLHASNTYVVSPTAPIYALENYAVDWRKRFALPARDFNIPTLGQILQTLSGYVTHEAQTEAEVSVRATASGISRPRPWAAIIPSKDQKIVYMDMLAWLIARNLVVQIRTFAFVWVSSSVKRAVKEGNTREGQGFSATKSEAQRDEDHAVDSRPHRSLLSILRDSSRPASAAGSTGTAPTAIPISSGNVSRQQSREQLTRPSTPEGTDDDPDLAPSLIESPADASPLEQSWINHIGERLKDANAKTLWPVLVRYFDGTHAVEEIAAIEGWKRALLAGVFQKLVAGNVVRTTRYW